VTTSDAQGLIHIRGNFETKSVVGMKAEVGRHQPERELHELH